MAAAPAAVYHPPQTIIPPLEVGGGVFYFVCGRGFPVRPVGDNSTLSKSSPADHNNPSSFFLGGVVCSWATIYYMPLASNSATWVGRRIPVAVAVQQIASPCWVAVYGRHMQYGRDMVQEMRPHSSTGRIGCRLYSDLWRMRK